MPKVSVLVPIYNVEKYLSQCLDSIINQKLDDIEIILINDGSNDSSPLIIEKYQNQDKRIKVINKINTGYGNSMNLGLDMATGEYIGIVEPDDFIEKDMFFDLYDLAKKYNSDLVKSDYFGFQDNQKRKMGKFASYPIEKPIDIFEYPSLVRMQPSIWSGIYRKEFLDNNNIRFLESPGASFQDTSFAFKTFCLAKNIILTDKPYLNYRMDNENSSVKSQSKVFLITLEYNEIDKFLNDNPKIKKAVNSNKLIKQYKTYIWNLKRIEPKFYLDFIERFCGDFERYYQNNEIDNVFYKKINKKEFNLLISDKDKFKKRLKSIIKKEKDKEKRRKMISIHLNSSRLSVVLFGKQIIKIG